MGHAHWCNFVIMRNASLYSMRMQAQVYVALGPRANTGLQCTAIISSCGHRHSVVQDAWRQAELPEGLEHAECHAFGSQTDGLGLPGSDLDVQIVLPAVRSPLLLVATALRRCTVCQCTRSTCDTQSRQMRCVMLAGLHAVL